MTSTATLPKAAHPRQTRSTTWLQRLANFSVCGFFMLFCACDGETVVDGATDEDSGNEDAPPTTCEVPADCALADTCVQGRCVPACAVDFQIDSAALLQPSGCLDGDILDLEPNQPQLVPSCTVRYQDHTMGFEMHECALGGEGENRHYLRDPVTDRIVPPQGLPYCFTIATHLGTMLTIDTADDLTPACAEAGKQIELTFHPSPSGPPLPNHAHIVGRCLLQQPPLPRECQDLE